MKKQTAIQALKKWDKQGRYVFTKHELAKLFPQDNPKTFSEGLHRLVTNGFLQRVCRGVYVNQDANSFDRYVLERIAKAMRQGEYNYISLESVLSEYGLISQIPVDRLTIMTTGRKGIYTTLYGTIEFTHTKRSVSNILDNTRVVEDHPLRIATEKAALRDLKRVGRNVKLINEHGFNHD